MTALTERDISLIRKHPLFSGVASSGLEPLLALLKASEAAYEKGAALLRAGEPADRFGIVLEGAVHVCSDDIEGNRTIMSDSVPGDSFGEALCFLNVADSPVYALAAENTRILWLSADPLFAGGSAAVPDVDARSLAALEKRFTAVLAKRMLKMNSRVRVLSKIKLRDKLCTFFAEQAAENGARTFTLSMNREDMALYMGTDRSALSRELAHMKRDGLIDYYRNTFKVL